MTFLDSFSGFSIVTFIEKKRGCSCWYRNKHKDWKLDMLYDKASYNNKLQYSQTGKVRWKRWVYWKKVSASAEKKWYSTWGQKLVLFWVGWKYEAARLQSTRYARTVFLEMKNCRKDLRTEAVNKPGSLQDRLVFKSSTVLCLLYEIVNRKKAKLKYLRYFGRRAFFLRLNPKGVGNLTPHLWKKYLLGSEKKMTAESFTQKII